MSRSKLPRVRSLNALRILSGSDPRFAKLACLASSNLGGPKADLDAALSWLDTNAREVGEAATVDEVNFCRDLVR